VIGREGTFPDGIKQTAADKKVTRFDKGGSFFCVLNDWLSKP
jgi:hypothetical protein